MPTCPQCGSTVPEGAVYCGKCGSTLNPATLNSTTSVSTTQSGTPQANSGPWSNSSLGRGDMSMRLEKAVKRSERLSYATVGLAVVILVIVLVLTLYP
jgi:uncharacterized membrane protein YvbJ